MKKKVILISIISVLIIITIILIGIEYFKPSDKTISQIEEISTIKDDTNLSDIKPIENEKIISENIIEEQPTSADVEQEDIVEVTEKATVKEVTTSPTVQSNKVTETTPPKTSSTSTSTQTTTSNNPKTNVETTNKPSTPSQSETQKPTLVVESKPAETPVAPTPTPTRCTNNNNHGMDVGNSGQWFSTKNEAIAYYNNKVSYWGNLWETDQIDDATYYKNCPSGYEVWSCMYCEKWTINFYYR